MNSLSKFHYAFHLYNILREPIPFEIQCKISNNEQKQHFNHTNCSALTVSDYEQYSLIKNDKRDYSYTLFRSSPVDVLRKLPSNFFEQEKSSNPSKDLIPTNQISSHLSFRFICFDSRRPIYSVLFICLFGFCSLDFLIICNDGFLSFFN
jgi:hypothetical protein